MDVTHLVTYTVYNKPRDFPANVVVRRFRVVAAQVIPDPAPWSVNLDLQQARDSIPEGLIRLVRNENDDPCIVETWL